MDNNDIKQAVVKLPVIGYLSRLVSNIVRLPKIHDQLVASQAETNKLVKSSHREQKELIDGHFTDLSGRLTGIQLAQDNLRQQFSILETTKNMNKAASVNQNGKHLLADDHLLDKFYIDFEDRFRGTEDLILKRQQEYLPFFQNSQLDFNKKPVLDIGSGRGELLQLLKKHKIRAVGLDINHDMVKRSKDKGLEAVQGDALEHLQKAKSQSYGAITGFHIVEHIPFNLLLRIFDNAHRALAENGFVIFETPNPENIIVGCCAFYMDPSHLHPLPPDLLAFALETCGFKNIEIRRLHPVDNVPEEKTKGLPKEVANRFYGPRDYAVIGYK